MTDQIARGLLLAAQRPEVMPDHADDRIRALYDDVQRTLRVPFVNLIFRTLANDPDYLIPVWEQTAPMLRTLALERAADALRAEALLEPVPDASDVAWADTGPLDRIRTFSDTIHYVLPKVLLIVTAWDEGAFGGDGAVGDTSPLPLGIADGTGTSPSVSEAGASERVRDLFRRERERHGHPLVSSYYKVLGNWPEFFDAAWTRVEPIVGSPAYERHRQTLVEHATRAVRTLPLGRELPRAARTADVSALLAALRRAFIPTMMLDVALVTAMLDGPASARRSRFSAATPGI